MVESVMAEATTPDDAYFNLVELCIDFEVVLAMCCPVFIAHINCAVPMLTAVG